MDIEIKVKLSYISLMIGSALADENINYEDLAKDVINQFAVLCLPDKKDDISAVLSSQNRPAIQQENMPPKNLNFELDENLKKFIEEVKFVETTLHQDQIRKQKQLDEVKPQPQASPFNNNDSNIHFQMMKKIHEENEVEVQILEQKLAMIKEKKQKVDSLKNSAPQDVYNILHERLSNIMFPESKGEEGKDPRGRGQKKVEEVITAQFIQVNEPLSQCIRKSGFQLPEIQNLEWPQTPNYNNPIQFIESTAADSISPFFNFTLLSGEKTEFNDVSEPCKKVSKRIERVKKAIIYQSKLDGTLMGIKLEGEENKKICTMGSCDCRISSITKTEVSLTDKERIVGISSHKHGDNALHFGFQFLIARLDD